MPQGDHLTPPPVCLPKPFGRVNPTELLRRARERTEGPEDSLFLRISAPLVFCLFLQMPSGFLPLFLWYLLASSPSLPRVCLDFLLHPCQISSCIFQRLFCVLSISGSDCPFHCPFPSQDLQDWTGEQVGKGKGQALWSLGIPENIKALRLWKTGHLQGLPSQPTFYCRASPDFTSFGMPQRVPRVPGLAIALPLCTLVSFYTSASQL